MNAEHERPAGEGRLAHGLLKSDDRAAAAPAEAHELAKRILRRDRRWVAILAAATAVFLLLGVVGICGSLYSFYRWIVPAMERVGSDLTRASGAGQGDSAHAEAFYATTAQAFFVSHVSQRIILWIVSASVAALLAAGVCTVLLVLATRRATLRQIQASLRAISEQVETLQQSLRAAEPPGPSQVRQEPDG